MMGIAAYGAAVQRFFQIAFRGGKRVAHKHVDIVPIAARHDDFPAWKSNADRDRKRPRILPVTMRLGYDNMTAGQTRESLLQFRELRTDTRIQCSGMIKVLQGDFQLGLHLLHLSGASKSMIGVANATLLIHVNGTVADTNPCAI